MKILNEYLKLEGIEELRQFSKNVGRKTQFKKNEFFFRQGSICKYVGYIESGAFRYLGYTSDGKEQIVGYSFENDFSADYISFLNDIPSVADAQAIEDSIAWLITREELMDFFNNCTDKDLRSQIAETFLGDIHKRMMSFYCDTPKERYLKLIAKYPEILNLVSLKEIASFIKVTPETLSRIRKNISLT